MAPYEDEFDANGEPMWLYSIETESTAQQGMFAVRVTVARNDESGGGAEYTLVRWMIDPEYLATLTSSTMSTTGGQP
jgi:hypothetical protein